MMKNLFKIIVILAIGAVGGLFAGQFSWPESQLASISNPVIETKQIIIQENVALQDCVEKVKKSIVGIKTKTKEGKIISGSGLVATSDGLIVTLAELVPSKGEFVFFVDGKTSNWQILKRDVKSNLALVKVDLNNLTTVGFSDLDKTKLGQRVFLSGVILSNTKPLLAVNEGIIKFFTSEYIRTNMNEKKTLSGSALFDIEGELLGLNTIDIEGKVTAIPITKIKTFLGY